MILYYYIYVNVVIPTYIFCGRKNLTHQKMSYKMENVCGAGDGGNGGT